jgi:NADPH-dependent ferric siderophore reductase
VLLAGEESALPALEGILRSLPPGIGGHAVLEVPTRDDVRELATGPGVQVHWVVRSEVDPAALAGAGALSVLTELPAAPDTYAFLVGESALATGGRRHLVRAGLGKDRITFCGFWKAPARQRGAVVTY